MKKRYIAIALGALLLSACGGKSNDARQRGRDYERMLSDSIEAVQRDIDSCDMQVRTLHEQTDRWLADFTTVANPREVGSYMIYTPFRNRYPLTGTGLAARVTDTGEFQIIAALKKSRFDKIRVIAPGGDVTTEAVPHDQALNYWTDDLTTVTFSGAAADSIGRLIADNGIDNVRVNYLGTSLIYSMMLPTDVKEMVLATWRLYSSTSGAKRLEAQSARLHEKLNILRAHRDRASERNAARKDSI